MSAIVEILTSVRSWIEVLTPIATGIFGWFGSRVQARITAQRSAVDGQNAENQKTQLMLEREKVLTGRLAEAMREARDNWRLLYEREAVLIQYHAAAIGARLSVHEWEMRSGRKPTPFEPLPGYPPQQNSTAAHEAVDQAASTADPGAQTPTSKLAPPTTAVAEHTMVQKNEGNINAG
nr:hypothetical protein [uncultured Neokomagataea sp.]